MIYQINPYLYAHINKNSTNITIPCTKQKHHFTRSNEEEKEDTEWLKLDMSTMIVLEGFTAVRHVPWHCWTRISSTSSIAEYIMHQTTHFESLSPFTTQKHSIKIFRSLVLLARTIIYQITYFFYFFLSLFLFLSPLHKYIHSDKKLSASIYFIIYFQMGVVLYLQFSIGDSIKCTSSYQ